MLSANYSQVNGITTLTFSRLLTASGLNPISTTGQTSVLVAHGAGNAFEEHSFRIVRSLCVCVKLAHSVCVRDDF
jgi:hypothetical protein